MRTKLPISECKLSVGNVVFFIVLHAAALLAFLPQFFSWSGVALMFLFYWLTASLGICLGFHRYLTHRSMDLPPWLGYFFVTLGSLACENGPIRWTAHHRMHHVASDTEKDPHNAALGFWWSHLLWLIYIHPSIDDQKNLDKYTRDISGDKYLQFLDNHFIKIQVVLGVVFLALGGWSWVIWGIALRLVVVYHVTWLVNSASHMFGYKNFQLENDLSTNCWWVGLLAAGEGWHNNHHAYPLSARHGLRPWEIDITWMFICLLGKLGLAKNIKVVELTPAPAGMASQDLFTGEMVKKAA